MSGPIVRTGTTPKFWENYDRIFGGAKKTGETKKAKPEVKTTKKSAKKKAGAKKKK
jgi:hypothetical protein